MFHSSDIIEWSQLTKVEKENTIIEKSSNVLIITLLVVLMNVGYLLFAITNHEITGRKFFYVNEESKQIFALKNQNF